jgi:hypothetical protein
VDELRQIPEVLVHDVDEPIELGELLAPLPKPRVRGVPTLGARSRSSGGGS